MAVSTVNFSELIKAVFVVRVPAAAQVQHLVEEARRLGLQVEISADFQRDVSEDSDVGSYVIEIDDTAQHGNDALHLAERIAATGRKTPIWALADNTPVGAVDRFDLMASTEGFIYLGQQTPAYYAKQIASRLQDYGLSLLPPFFGRLLTYDYEGNIAFDCPGHQGGQFYRKSPVGQLFFKHFGEGIFRNDLCNADVALGDLLIHEGAAVEAQKFAAQVFGADKTYFVLNGTSTSNRIVTNALLKPDDLVLFDRNNHKSNHQGGLVMSGALPVYLPTARNPFGMVGAMDWDGFDEARLREQIRQHPLVKDKSRADAKRPFRLAIIQLATYDGTVYNAERVLEKIGHLCDYVLWDEAWIGYNAFHPLFAGHSPMRIENLGPEMPGLFSTQSVHKQLAGFSQASQIHKKDQHIRDENRWVSHKRFNEAYLLHVSTSPFYPLFASLDVNAKIHEGKNGEVMWDECIALGVEARKKFREIGAYYQKAGASAEEKWFFDPFVPDKVSIKNSVHHKDVEHIAWEKIPTEVITQEQQCWVFDPKAKWHGYRNYAEGYAMVDPNKLTLLTPGIDRRTSNYLDFGIPATVVANFLREHHIVPEKCDLNSILFLMTPAEDESKINTLISQLLRFKALWDRDAPLQDVLPTIASSFPERYAGYSLRQVCKEMHDFYRQANIKDLQRDCFRAEHFPEQAMKVCDAYHALVANEVDYLPLTEIKGRIAATLALIYPPGIGVVVPGERWDERAQPMLDYFLAFEDSFNRFPGFSYEVQGVYQEQVDGKIRFYTYAVRE
ncbi:MAG: ornithine decarboxylase [Proteobacteria bacterium]|nr:ornithine decarboxylase [Pseudomonadota bacterium]